MIKWILSFALALFSISAYAFGDCPRALATDNAKFCTSFETSAKCHCINKTPKPLSTAYCTEKGSMEKIYKRMIGVYKTVEDACKKQKDTLLQDCVDAWKCYREGGFDSKGKKCSGTGDPCPKEPK